MINYSSGYSSSFTTNFYCLESMDRFFLCGWIWIAKSISHFLCYFISPVRFWHFQNIQFIFHSKLFSLSKNEIVVGLLYIKLLTDELAQSFKMYFIFCSFRKIKWKIKWCSFFCVKIKTVAIYVTTQFALFFFFFFGFILFLFCFSLFSLESIYIESTRFFFKNIYCFT